MTAEPAISAFEHALRLLGRRARTTLELQRDLARHGFPAEEIAAALERASELGYLDDRRFAVDRAMQLFRQRRWGTVAIVTRVMEHGFSEAEARDAVQVAEQELGLDPLSVARGLLRKRGLEGRALEPAETARAARFLLHHGFAEEVVAKLLDLDGGEA